MPPLAMRSIVGVLINPPKVLAWAGPTSSISTMRMFGASLGAASHHDFRLLCALVRQMHTGGVYLNWSSTALVPETFLKAASLVRDLGVPLRPITTANFDLRRPGLLNGDGKRAGVRSRSDAEQSHDYAIAGHHEIMLPLVAAALVEGASGVTLGGRRTSKAQIR